MIKSSIATPIVLGLALVVSACERSSDASKAKESATLTVPPGTVLVVSLKTPLNSESNRDGDMFTATLADPIVVNGETVLESGTPVLGTVTLVEAPGEGHRARMTLALTSVEPTLTGKEPLETSRLQLEAEAPTGDAQQPPAIAAGHLFLQAGRTLQFTLSEPAAFALRTEEGY